MNYLVTYQKAGETLTAELWAEDDSSAADKARLCYGPTAVVTRDE